MEQELMDRCDLFAVNHSLLSSQFKWESDLMNYAAATVYTSQMKEIEPERMKECLAVLKSKTGELSEYRGNIKTTLLSKMALSDDPASYFDRVEQVYKLLHKSVWMGNEHKLLAAVTICEHKQPEEYQKYVDRTNEIYDCMKKKHSWLTSDEDIPFAAMLAVSDLSIDRMIENMEEMYAVLKKEFYDNNAVQSLSHVLCLVPESSEVKCEKVIQIYHELKARKHKFGSGYELTILGALTALPLSVEQIVDRVIEADDYLKSKKGFGDLGLGSSNRRLYAALMVMDTYKKDCTTKGDILLGSVLTMTITMEICLIIAIMTINTTVITNS